MGAERPTASANDHLDEDWYKYGPPTRKGEVVPGLLAWMKHLALEDHMEVANACCEEMGAAVLDEGVEAKEDLAEALPISPEEKARFLKRARLAQSVLEQHNEIVKQEDVVTIDFQDKTNPISINREKNSKSQIIDATVE